MASSGTDRPARCRRADRSRGVKIELLVRTRKRRSRATNRSRKSAAPGSARSSCTSTPSMSVSQHSAGPRTLMPRTLPSNPGRVERTVDDPTSREDAAMTNPRQNVTFPSNGGEAHGYLRKPESGSGPGLVVIQEWWGLDDHMADLVDRFAAEGFVTLAPDLFGGRVAHDSDEAGKLLQELPVEQAAKDLGG